HLVLLVYAKTATGADHFAKHFREQGEHAGLELVVAPLEGTTLADRKEHFGFRDGIAQPTVEGSGRGGAAVNTIAAGEILLGQRDGYGNVSYAPTSPEGFAFGMNGSYLVFRQLEQRVEAFWRHCATRNGAGHDGATSGPKPRASRAFASTD